MEIGIFILDSLVCAQRSMVLLIVGFEMSLQVAQRIDPRPAALTKRRALFGRSYGNFLKHGRQ